VPKYVYAMEEGYSLSAYRRSYNRFNIEGQATLSFDKGLSRPSILKDLSAGGAGVICNEPLGVNEEIGIFIPTSLLLKSSVYKKAKVVWCSKIGENLWQAGLAFGWDNKISLTGI